MTSIILHTRRPNCQYKVCSRLVFMFQLILIFRILRSCKHVIHISPFRPTIYVLMILRRLEVSNRLRKRNKLKNFIFLGLKIDLCQLEKPIFIYKLMCQISLINLFHFISVNLIV